jgi:hypothetical protein
MNADILKGKWKQMVGGFKQKWADLLMTIGNTSTHR